jgi:hypothetical protein
MEIKNIGSERVSLISGKTPAIVIAPHGYEGDDKNTAFLAEYVAAKLDCYAVINRGWERADFVDANLDKADCNNVDHCYQDVVREEFLDPIFRLVKKISRKHRMVFTFYLHGMSNLHRIKSGIYDLDIVVGYGDSRKKNFSCSIWKKDLLCFSLYQNGFTVAEGGLKSNLTGSKRTNMNQLFVQTEWNPFVQSMQIEIIEQRRKDIETTKKTGDLLATAFWKTVDSENFYSTATFESY